MRKRKINKKMKIKRITLIFILILAAFLTDAVSQEEIKVIDGDTLHINNAKIRLFGIDAPEINQTCYDEKGAEYPCGVYSKKALKQLVTAETKCIIKDMDKYKRILSICYNGDTDINQEMVLSGHAIAYTRYSVDYAPAEEQARNNRHGVWQGKFIDPEQYRIRNTKK